MNRKLAIGIVAIAGTLCLLPPAANATGTTAPPTTTATVPTECLFSPIFTGPARATHSPESARPQGAALPDCDSIEGICVILPLEGPSRTLHGITGTILVVDPCEGVDEACIIETSYPDRGPSRVVHSRPQVFGSWPVEIPTACQEVLSAAAIPATGSDSVSTVWLAGGFLLAGVVLVFGVRRVAAR